MNAIKHIRKHVLQIRQGEMAALTGVSQTTVCRWERGEQAPSLRELALIREAAIERGLPWDDGMFFAPAPSENAA